MAHQEEIIIDCANLSEEELRLAKEQTQLVFQLNHTMPMTEKYDELLHRIFPNIGEGSRINTPITDVRPHNVKIGKNVIVMNDCLMMSAGGITIEDNVQIAANAQLISNNHDLDNRSIITCKPVHLCKNVWIGAGATILAGVTIGENSVVTKNVEPNTIVAGNPARLIKKENQIT